MHNAFNFNDQAPNFKVDYSHVLVFFALYRNYYKIRKQMHSTKKMITLSYLNV